MTEDLEILDEVEHGWRTFSARWQQAANAGRISRDLLETQRGFYYAATRHAIIMIARAGEQEMLEDPRHGAQRLAERLQRMLGLIDMQAAIVRARRSSRIPLVGAGRLRRLARAGVVILGLGLMLLWSYWAEAFKPPGIDHKTEYSRSQ